MRVAGFESRQSQLERVEMSRGRNILGSLAIALLAMAVAAPLPSVAQRGSFHPVQRRQAPPPGHPPAARQQQAERPQQGPHPQGHAGDWLRRYKDLSPEEQERALQNDPAFRSLPPEKQQLYLHRLQRFSNLPPQRQLQMLNRMETWEHLTPEQKTEAKQVFSQFRQLPPERKRMVETAVRDLRAMPPDQREQVINSDRFKGMFSDQERDMMREVTRLPLAPPDGGEGGPE